VVGVINGDSILLTKYANRKMSFYALVAGFVEIGETLEECVAREVMEETGLKVKNIRYYKSQPWGSVQDLIVGFYCEVDGDTTIRMDKNELKEALWMKRENIQGQTDDWSLTNQMMMKFKEGDISILR
jgi:NAD+ diphosphatase